MYLIYDPHCDDWKFTSPTESSAWTVNLADLLVLEASSSDHEYVLKKYARAIFYPLDNFDDLADTYPELLV